MREIKSLPNLLETNLFYLFIALLLITVGSIVQIREIYSGLLITEYILILIPTLLYLKIRGFNLKKVLRLNGLSKKQVLLIPLIVILSYPIGAFLNAAMMVIISLFGNVNPPPIPVPSSQNEFFLGFIIIALTPGICEEFMFRGMIMHGYESQGVKRSIILSAILFGLFHFNIQNLLGPIFLGALFGYIVVKTNSLYASILAHSVNNSIAWVLSYFINSSSIAGKSQPAAQLPSHTVTLLIGTIALGGIALVTGSIVYKLLKKMPTSKESVLLKVSYNSDFKSKNELIISYFPALIVLGIFVYFTIRMIM